jgi:hypothetical protein
MLSSEFSCPKCGEIWNQESCLECGFEADDSDVKDSVQYRRKRSFKRELSNKDTDKRERS